MAGTEKIGLLYAPAYSFFNRLKKEEAFVDTHLYFTLNLLEYHHRKDPMKRWLLGLIRTRSTPVLPGWFAAPAFFPILLILCLSLHAIIRLLHWKSLEYDEAEQLVFIQTLSPGYSGQPPLYTWLLWGISKCFGPDVLSITILKIGLLAALYVLLYRIALMLLKDARWAGLVAISPLLTPVFAWEVFRLTTHTPLLCVLILATLWVLLRMRESSRLQEYILLGCCFGLGALSKHSYAFFIAPLLLAALFEPNWRRSLLNPRILLSLFLALLLFLPHGLWLLQHYDEVTQSITKYASTGSRVSWASGWLTGLVSLAKNLGLGLGLLSLCVLVCFPLVKAWRGSVSKDQDRFLTRCLIFTSILLLGSVLIGVKAFRVHWFAPLCLLMPIWFFLILKSISASTVRLANYSGIVALSVICILLIRASTLCFDWRSGMYQTRDFLYFRQAEEVRAEGFQSGAIITSDIIIAGYQRLYFPEVPVHCVRYISFSLAMPEGEPLLLVWDATYQEDGRQLILEHLTRKCSAVITGFTPSIVETERCKFDSSTKRLGYAVMNPEANTSRKLAHQPNGR